MIYARCPSIAIIQQLAGNGLSTAQKTPFSPVVGLVVCLEMATGETNLRKCLIFLLFPAVSS
jgi:hypothetical protein